MDIGRCDCRGHGGAAIAANFDIPGGDLDAALEAYIAQSGVLLLVPNAVVRGVHTDGVKGKLSEGQALSRILKGTGFVAKSDPSGALGIARESHSELSVTPIQLAQASSQPRADPVIGQAHVLHDPFDWSADLASDDEASLRFFGEASDFGIRYGRTVPIHDRRGWVAAVTYATDRMRPAYRACLDRNADTLQLIALYFHAHAQRAFDLEDLYSGPHLTDRELECLYWASQGKSACDIAEILGLSGSTVKFHLRNVRAKFRVGTTIQAAIAFDRAQRPHF